MPEVICCCRIVATGHSRLSPVIFRGQPPRVAAVLFIDKKSFYSDWQPTDEVMKHFAPRRDAQIMGLEMLSIAFGLSQHQSSAPWPFGLAPLAGISCFEDLLRNRNAVVYSDNVGAERAVAKGGAKAFDHTCIAHCIWYSVPLLLLTPQLHIISNIAGCKHSDSIWASTSSASPQRTTSLMSQAEKNIA